MCQKAERTANKSEEEVIKMGDLMQKMKEKMALEIERLREPLAAEVSKMLWENQHMAEQFESSKADYRVLVGDFLKVIQNRQEEVQSRDKLVRTTFYSEQKRLKSPETALTASGTQEETWKGPQDMKAVPLPDIPRLLSKNGSGRVMSRGADSVGFKAVETPRATTSGPLGFDSQLSDRALRGP